MYVTVQSVGVEIFICLFVLGKSKQDMFESVGFTVTLGDMSFVLLDIYFYKPGKRFSNAFTF